MIPKPLILLVSIVTLLLGSYLGWAQPAQNPLRESPPSLSIQPILPPATGEENLPSLIEVVGSSEEDVLPQEPTDSAFEVDVRGKGNFEIFQIAGEAYDRDALETAAAYYHALIDRGVRHGDVYFNLANTYFRMSDQLGWAILFYEKGLKLRPRDLDLQHNLDYAKNFLIDVPPKAPPSAMDTLLIFHRQTTFNETFWILCVLNILFVGLLLTRTFRLGFSRSVYYGYLRGVVATLFILQLASAGAKIWEESNVREGVILSDSIQAKASPTAEETLIELNSGAKVGILDSRSGYAHIRLPDGTPAFIPISEIGEI